MIKNKQNNLEVLTNSFLISKNNIGHFDRSQNNLTHLTYEDVYEPHSHSLIAEQIFSACTLLEPNFQEKLSSMTVLDVGCSIGSFAYSIKDKVKSLVGIDIENEAIECAQAYVDYKNYSNLKFFVDDAINFEKTKLSYSSSFDLIILKDVVEHISNLNNFSIMINNLTTLLRPGGIIFIECPNYIFPYEPHLKIPIIPMSTKKILLKTARLFRKIKTIEDENFINHLNIVSPSIIENELMSNNLIFLNAYEEWKLKKIFFSNYQLSNSYKFFQPIITLFKTIGFGQLGYLFFKSTKLYPTLWYIAKMKE